MHAQDGHNRPDRVLSAIIARWKWKMVFSVLGAVVGAMLVFDHIQAGGFKSPEECLAYTREAHLNCLYAYIEIQQGKIAKLQEDVNTQKSAAGRLQDQLNRQTSMTEHLQGRIKDRDETIRDFRQVQISPFLGFSYSYGYPFSYGSSFFYGHRFFGPCYGPFYSYPCW